MLNPTPLDWGDGYVVYSAELPIVATENVGDYTTFNHEGDGKVTGRLSLDYREQDIEFTLPVTPKKGSYLAVTDREAVIVVFTEPDIEIADKLPLVPHRFVADPRDVPLIEEKYRPFAERESGLVNTIRFGAGRRLAPLIDMYVRRKLGCKWLSVDCSSEEVTIKLSIQHPRFVAVSVETRVRIYAIGHDGDDERAFKTCYNPPFPITAADASAEWQDDTLTVTVKRVSSLGDVEVSPLHIPQPEAVSRTDAPQPR